MAYVDIEEANFRILELDRELEISDERANDLLEKLKAAEAKAEAAEEEECDQVEKLEDEVSALKEKALAAERILDLLGISERDLLLTENQIDPVRTLLQWRGESA